MKKSLLIKSIALGLLLLLAQSQQFSASSVIIFLFFALLFYVQPIFHTSSLLFSFFSFLALALLIPSRFAAIFEHAGFSSTPALGLLLFSAVFACLLYIIVGVKNLALIRRREWYYLLFLSLTYLALFLFFSIGPVIGFWLKSLAIFIFSCGSLREFLRFQGIEVGPLHKLGVFVIALIELECLWAVSLLPIGLSNSAGFMTVLVFILSEMTSRYMRGTLTARFVRTSFLSIPVAMFVIYFIATWKL